MSTAVDVIRQFRQRRALVIGDVMLDSYLEGSASRLCSEGPVPVVRKTGEERVPGGAANTAANLRALGAEVVLLGLVGGDSVGRLLRAALAERGVGDSALVSDRAVSTLHKLRILADGQYVVRFDEGETRSVSPRGQALLCDQLERHFAACDLVVVSDYCYGVVADALLDRLRRLRAERPCVLLVDSKNLGRFARVGATVVTPNHLEARLVVEPGGRLGGPDTPAEIERIGQRLLDRLDSESVAITRASEGVSLFERRGAVRHLPARPVPQVNDVGAGDSFAAALALALAAGADAAAAAQIALDAAGIAVGKRRTAIVHHQELLQRVSLRDHGAPRVEALADELAEQRRLGRTLVFTNGVFDLLHAGHIQFLREAKALGDVLVVGVNSDASARRLKGRRRPITGEQDRLALVAALDAVDHVVPFDEDTPASLIRRLCPDIHVKGGDYADEPLPEAEAVREVGGQVVIVPLIEQWAAEETRPYSTGAVINRILALAGDDALGVGQ